MILDAGKLKKVDDFLYLGAWISSSKRDIIVRIVNAWFALQKMDNVWKSALQRNIKVEFFTCRSTVEKVLLYGRIKCMDSHCCHQ